MNDDAPEQTGAAEEDLDLIRQTAAHVFTAGQGGLRDLGEMGWLGLLSTHETGGSGWLPVEAAAVAHEAGKARDPHGWASATLGAGVMSAVQDDDLRARWSVGALDGATPVRWVRTSGLQVEPQARTVTSNGSSGHVVGASEAAAYVVSDDNGRLLLVAADKESVVVTRDPRELDTRNGVQRVQFRAAPFVPLPLAAATRDELHSAALLLGASAAAGPLGDAVGRLVEYLSERMAFGAPIASFQAIQHRLVDLYVLQRRIEAVLESAARRLEVLAPDSLRLACIAHAYVSDRIVPALDECIQLSGAIGFVWEYPLHHEMRSALGDVNEFGTARSSRALLATIDGW